MLASITKNMMGIVLVWASSPNVVYKLTNPLVFTLSSVKSIICLSYECMTSSGNSNFLNVFQYKSTEVLDFNLYDHVIILLLINECNRRHTLSGRPGDDINWLYFPWLPFSWVEVEDPPPVNPTDMVLITPLNRVLVLCAFPLILLVFPWFYHIGCGPCDNLFCHRIFLAYSENFHPHLSGQGVWDVMLR